MSHTKLFYSALVLPVLLIAQIKNTPIDYIDFSEDLHKINPSDLINAAGFEGAFNPLFRVQYASQMEQYLNREGYLYARIEEIEAHYNSDSSSVNLNISGSAGSMVLFGDIKITSDSLSNENYYNLLGIRKFDPFNQQLIESDINRLLLFAADSGFVYARVNIRRLQVQNDDGELLAHLDIQINENEIATIDRIEIKGNSYTRPHVVLRELPVKTGDKYSKSLVDDIPRQLLRMGLFKEIKPPDLFVSKNGEYILSLQVEEGNATTFDGVVGYIPESKNVNNQIKNDGFFTGLININFNNLFGTARRFEVHWEKPDRESEYFKMAYREPWFLNYPFHLGFGLERTVRDSTYIEWKGNFSVEWAYSRNLSFFTALEKQVVLPDSVSNRDLRLARYEQYNIEAGIKYDTRDYPLNPRQGLYFENSYTFGFKNNYGPGYLLREDSIAVNEELKLYKMSFNWYYELLRNQVFSFQLTGRQVTGDRLQITDYFWFGGAQTLRGYRENQFRGDFASWLKLEYRFLLSRDARIFVFNDWAAYHFKNMQLETEDILYGYGIGLRLDTVLGIMAVDFGLGQDDDFSQAKIHFGIINRF